MDPEEDPQLQQTSQQQIQQQQQQQHQVQLQNGETIVIDYSGRFPFWVGLTVFSFMSMISVLSKRHEFDGSEKWALIVTIVSFLLGFISTVSYVTIRGLFLAQLPERIASGIVLGLWGFGLPSLMNPNHGIAVNESGEVINANLYFFAWAAFVCSIMIFGNLVQDILGINVRTITSMKMVKWYCLLAASLVVMGSSIRYFKAFNCGLDEYSSDVKCRRTKLSISIGVISFWASAIICYAIQTQLSTPTCEFYLSSIMLVWWCLGLAYITFGDGPGDSIGNLFFATWISFVISIFIYADCLKDFLAAREQSQNNTTNNTTTVTTMDGEVHTVNETTVSDL